jgi:hypothetical protein
MVDLSIVKRLPEGKPPFSYGFPMVFPSKPPFSNQMLVYQRINMVIVP